MSNTNNNPANNPSNPVTIATFRSANGWSDRGLVVRHEGDRLTAIMEETGDAWTWERTEDGGWNVVQAGEVNLSKIDPMGELAVPSSMTLEIGDLADFDGCDFEDGDED